MIAVSIFLALLGVVLGLAYLVLSARREVWVVERTGVYGQGIVGVFSDEKAAKIAAEASKALERDSYHNFEVTHFIVDESVILWGQEDKTNDT